MTKFYIIGASGLIGGALFSLLKSKNLNVVGTYSNNKEEALIYFDMNKGDYRCFDNVNEGDIFYLLSAYSNPSWIAQNKTQAEELNYTSTIKLIDFLMKKKAKIVFMSSVEIFDGTKGNYSEKDYPNPLNYYGKLKLSIEKYLLDNSNNYTIVRTGWNVGLNEKSRCVVQLTYETLLKPNAKMAIDNFFSLSSIEDTAEGLYRSSMQNNLRKIHICSSEIISRLEMATILKNESKKGIDMDFSECHFKDIPYSEPRGRINDLDNFLSKDLLGMKYSNAYELIRKKIVYLDKTFITG